MFTTQFYDSPTSVFNICTFKLKNSKRYHEIYVQYHCPIQTSLFHNGDSFIKISVALNHRRQQLKAIKFIESRIPLIKDFLKATIFLNRDWKLRFLHLGQDKCNEGKIYVK